ncbi:UNVERIFIED_CONTAM: hypothetical protein NCL1_41776 [Trichonephila clavipes]
MIAGAWWEWNSGQRFVANANHFSQKENMWKKDYSRLYGTIFKKILETVTLFMFLGLLFTNLCLLRRQVKSLPTTVR